MKKKILISGSIIAAFLLSGCGDSGNNTKTSEYAVSGVAVDPYINDAQFCEDADLDGVCGSDEQLSTLSDAQGRFYFENAFQEQSRIIAVENGQHNGKSFMISMQADVSADDTSFVISPMTTMLSRELNASAMVSILQHAGISNITESDITGDPMAKFSLSDTTFTQAKVDALTAAISAYTFLRIADGSDQIRSLSGSEFYYSAMGEQGHHEIEMILTAMTAYIKGGLNLDTLHTMQAFQQQASTSYQNSTGSSLPEITVEDVIDTVVAIADYMAETGYEACNAAGGSYEAGLSAVATKSNNGVSIAAWAGYLGQMYYAYRIRNNVMSQAISYFPQTMQDAFACDSGVFEIATDGTVGCKP